MEYKLFTTKFCHKCPAMKEFLSSKSELKGSFIDASEPEGLEEAKQFNIQTVPTVVFVDDNNTELHRCNEKQDVEDFLKRAFH